MDFIIRFTIFALVTFGVSNWYERRRKNEILTISFYFAVVALVFLS